MGREYALINVEQPQIVLELAEEFPHMVVCNRNINMRKELYDRIVAAYKSDPLSGNLERWLAQSYEQTDPDLFEFAKQKLPYGRSCPDKTGTRVVAMIKSARDPLTVSSRVVNIYEDRKGNLRFDFTGDSNVFEQLMFSNNQWRIWGWQLVAIAEIDIECPDSLQSDPDGTIFAEMFKEHSTEKPFQVLSPGDASVLR